ncbi:alpha/beta fold hydrolase [Enterococcus sp.]|uniref:dienelactone hydrolase family protein n=1 Tax=Enterococcus sp. TaxID=35783 RepID=UPI0025C5C1B6|nr:alpha/beta fold hydrolase [Enterococcus sp.]
MNQQQRLQHFLGTFPQQEPVLLEKELIYTESYCLEKLLLDLNQQEPVPAYFAYPYGNQPVPFVLFNHSHGGDFTSGKEELRSSSSYLQPESFLEALIEDGYAVGAIDMWGFGEREQGESALFKKFSLYGQTLWGQRIYDNQQFLSYILSRTEVDSHQIATIGMSMGGLMSWWLAAVDERIALVVDLAAQVDYQTLIDENRLDKHGYYYYVPGVLTAFSTADIQKMIAPRPRLSLVGQSDPLCPIAGVEKINQELQAYYSSLGQPEHWQAKIFKGAHEETKEMRRTWRAFLNRHLDSIDSR